MFDNSKKRWILGAIFFVIVVGLLSWFFFSVNYTKVCEDDNCFNSALSICKKAEFLKDTTDARWYYKISGPTTNDRCEVYVKLAQLRKGGIEIVKLEGKDMICKIPYSVVESPQREIESCHGELKEEIQSLLIQKMHSYLLENLGQVNKEFTTVI